MSEAAAFRSLAASLRGGVSLEHALIDWPEGLGDGSCRGWAEQIAARVQLGVGPAEATAGGGSAFGASLGGIFAVHAELGGDLAGSLDELAQRSEARSESATGAAAQAAGAKLSARMISFLPLAFVVFVPGPKLPLHDPLAMTTMLLGISLVAIGSAWMAKLLPAPPRLDPAASVATTLAAVLRGGAAPSQVLSLMAERGGDGSLRSVSRGVELGLTWEEALLSSDDEGMQALGRTLDAAGSSGAPVAAALRAFAGDRERTAALTFEAQARRAPVRMVVPLTVCMLPAFLLLGAGPLVRGLST